MSKDAFIQPTGPKPDYCIGYVNKKVHEYKRQLLAEMVRALPESQSKTFYKVYGDPEKLVHDYLDAAIHNVEKWHGKRSPSTSAMLALAIGVAVGANSSRR